MVIGLSLYDMLLICFYKEKKYVTKFTVPNTHDLLPPPKVELIEFIGLENIFDVVG